MTNTNCPDYSSHRQNAEEIYFQGRQVPEVLTQDEDEAITLLADAEYKVCEGH